MKENILPFFSNHYENSLGPLQILENPIGNTTKIHFELNSQLLRPHNGPRLLYHGHPTTDVLILTHGLSDSPHYVSAIAQRFFEKGVNVLLPLLPAHGLRNPDKAMEDKQLDHKWRSEIDGIVEVAQQMGDRLSIGGFSTGGALGLNKILRSPKTITGGLFLFSAAIDVKLVKTLSKSTIAQFVTRLTDGKVIGGGRDPYKYPTFPYFGAVELGQIINENGKLLEGTKISQPVFAAHLAHDNAAKVEGITRLLANHVKKGESFIFYEDIQHAELPLDQNIRLNNNFSVGPTSPPKANPKFEIMMAHALRFFEEEVSRKESHL